MTALLDRPALARRLPARHRIALAAETTFVYLQARRLLRRQGLPAALAELRRRDDPSPPVDPLLARANAWRLGGAVTRTLAALPADSRCLMRSLVLTGLLARRGIDSSLVISVRPAEAFGAHAWVEVDGLALLEVGEADLATRLVTL